MSPEADRRRLIGRDFWADLPAGYRTVTYDRRGIGVSQRDVRDVSLERQVEDLHAVLGQLHITAFDLWCFGDAAHAGVNFAIRNPGRVTNLVLYTPWAYVGRTAAAERFEATAGIIRADWGMASRMFAQMLYPKGPLDAQESSTKAIRETQSPETALLYLAYTTSFDLRDDLGKLALPTLVISREGPGRPPLIPAEASRWVASAVPGARFVEYDKAAAACPYYQYQMYRGDVLQFLAAGTREMPLHPTLSARSRSAPPGRPGQDERRDRGAPGDQQEHRRPAREQHPHEDWLREPRGSHALRRAPLPRGRPGPALTRSCYRGPARQPESAQDHGS